LKDEKQCIVALIGRFCPRFLKALRHRATEKSLWVPPDGRQMGWDRAPTRISSWPTFIKRLEEFAHLEHNSTKNSVKRSG